MCCRSNKTNGEFWCLCQNRGSLQTRNSHLLVYGLHRLKSAVCFRSEPSSLLWSSSASSLGHRAPVHANGHRDAAGNLQMVTFCHDWNRFDSFLRTTPQVKVLLVPVSSSCSPPINIIKLAALTKIPGYLPKVIC